MLGGDDPWLDNRRDILEGIISVDIGQERKCLIYLYGSVSHLSTPAFRPHHGLRSDHVCEHDSDLHGDGIPTSVQTRLHMVGE